MKKLLSILILALAVFGLAGQPASAAIHCDSPVGVGASEDNYSDLQSALDECNDGTEYTDDLEFELHGYTETGSVQVPFGYIFSTGKKLILNGTGASGNGSSIWDSSGDRFVFSPYPLNGTGYAIFTNGRSVVLKGIQFKALINDDWWGGNAVVLLSGNVTVEDCFFWLYTPASVSTQMQKGTALKIIGDGSYVVRNTIIFGDYRATTGYGWFDAAVRIGTYSGSVNFYNTDLPPVAVPLITRGRPLPLSSAAA